MYKFNNDCHILNIVIVIMVIEYIFSYPFGAWTYLSEAYHIFLFINRHAKNLLKRENKTIYILLPLKVRLHSLLCFTLNDFFYFRI